VTVAAMDWGALARGEALARPGKTAGGGGLGGIAAGGSPIHIFAREERSARTWAGARGRAVGVAKGLAEVRASMPLSRAVRGH